MSSPDTAGISTPELAEQAGISPRQISYWTEQGWLHPEGDGGSGNWWSWPDAEVEVARRMGVLTAAGLPPEWSAGFARDGWPEGELAPGITVRVALPSGPEGE